MKNLEKGMTLVEVITALVAISIIVTALTTVVISSLDKAQFSRMETNAAQYAQEAVDFLRTIPPVTLSSNYEIYCFGEGQSSLPSQGSCNNTPNIDGKFIREIVIENNNSSPCQTSQTGLKKITVSVKWADGKCQGDSYCHKTELVSCIK